MNLKCVICFFISKKPKDADFVMNGQSLCVDHAAWAQGGNFSDLLRRVKSSEG